MTESRRGTPPTTATPAARDPAQVLYGNDNSSASPPGSAKMPTRINLGRLDASAPLAPLLPGQIVAVRLVNRKR